MLAERAPERARTLTLLDPAFVFGVPKDATAQGLADGAAPNTLDAVRPYAERVYARPLRTVAHEQALLREAQRANQFRGVDAMARVIVNMEPVSDARLRAIGTATLLIHGTEDGVAPIEQSRRIDELLPVSRLEEVTGIGHAMQVEAPFAFLDRLRGFLEEHDGAPDAACR